MNEQMTGRDLILYILKNNLENAPVVNNGRFLVFLTVDETAIRLGTGSATVKVWVERGYLPHVKIGNEIYIPHDAKPNLRGNNHDK